MASGANDIVVVRQPDGRLQATPVNLQIGEEVGLYCDSELKPKKIDWTEARGRNIVFNAIKLNFEPNSYKSQLLMG